MSSEMVDFLADSVRRLEASLEAARLQMEREHKELREIVVELERRVHAVETQQRVTQWAFGAGGAIVALCARELLVRFVL